jgi:hypothetical protein
VGAEGLAADLERDVGVQEMLRRRCPFHADFPPDSEAAVDEKRRRLQKLLPDEKIAAVAGADFRVLPYVCADGVARHWFAGLQAD